MRGVVHLDLEHGIIDFKVQCAFMSRLLRGEYGLHPAINFQAKAVCTENLNPDVVVVKAAEDRV